MSNRSRYWLGHSVAHDRHVFRQRERLTAKTFWMGSSAHGDTIEIDCGPNRYVQRYTASSGATPAARGRLRRRSRFSRGRRRGNRRRTSSGRGPTEQGCVDPGHRGRYDRPVRGTSGRFRPGGFSSGPTSRGGGDDRSRGCADAASFRGRSTDSLPEALQPPNPTAETTRHRRKIGRSVTETYKPKD